MFPESNPGSLVNTAIMADKQSLADFGEIQKQFLQMAPLKRFVWKEIEQTNLDLETQRKILHMTYFFTAKFKRAPSVAYQRLFLRHILKLCEDNGSEISDELYEAYGEVVSKVEQRDDKCYKTYMLPCGALITLEETQQFISQGTTGLSTWMAGEYLAEWALENIPNFYERNIIELGCGTGLTGLVICSTSSPCQYIFTDCHERVLEALECNLGLNGFVPSIKASETVQMPSSLSSETSAEANRNVNKVLGESLQRNSNLSSLNLTDKNCDNTENNQRTFSKSSEMAYSCTQGTESDGIPSCTAGVGDCCDGLYPSSSAINAIAHFSRRSDSYQHLNKDCGNHLGSVQVGVCKLEWGTLKSSDLETFSNIGIILAADVIYDVELIPLLVKTLHQLLSTCGDKGGKPVAYIASTIRNPQTYEFFVNQLGKHNIIWSEETQPRNQVFYYDHSCEIKILRLQI